MGAFNDYQTLIAEVDRRCRQIRHKYAEHIACVKGCAGNCCRIHISILPVEAVSFARALQKLPREKVRHIQQKARRINTFGPCPLLEGGACLIYDSRAIICRTHGLPISSEYRGHRSIGFCQKNFQNLPSIPDDDVIDLAYLNGALATVNDRFVSEFADRLHPGKRFTIGDVLFKSSFDGNGEVLLNNLQTPSKPVPASSI